MTVSRHDNGQNGQNFIFATIYGTPVDVLSAVVGQNGILDRAKIKFNGEVYEVILVGEQLQIERDGKAEIVQQSAAVAIHCALKKWFEVQVPLVRCENAVKID